MNAENVDASAEAYQRLSMRDAILGAGSYAAQWALPQWAALIARDRGPISRSHLRPNSRTTPTTRGILPWDQWTGHRAFCLWCLTAAATTFATAPLAIPEAIEATRSLKNQPAANCSERPINANGEETGDCL